MTDEERQAWDTFAAVALLALMSKNTTIYMEEQRDSHNAAEYADALLNERRERTANREQPAQDVSADLLRRCRNAALHGQFQELVDDIEAIQRARAAQRKGEQMTNGEADVLAAEIYSRGPSQEIKDFIAAGIRAATELATLRARVEELEKDRERLDWLGDGGVSIHANSLCYAIHDAASRDFMGEGGTFREAIDAARASAGERGE